VTWSCNGGIGERVVTRSSSGTRSESSPACSRLSFPPLNAAAQRPRSAEGDIGERRSMLDDLDRAPDAFNAGLKSQRWGRQRGGPPAIPSSVATGGIEKAEPELLLSLA